MLNTFDYCLPDLQLLKKKNDQFLIWIPDKTYIVLGASGNPDESLNMESVQEDHITVLKRPSGGETIILTPNNIMISAVFCNIKNLRAKDVFQRINRLIISSIEKTGIKGLSLVGISDIAVAGRRILGSAIYRSKNVLLYHAVLNLGEPAATFERYLKPSSKESADRSGRAAIDLTTSLKEKGYNKGAYHMENLLSLSFEESFCI